MAEQEFIPTSFKILNGRGLVVSGDHASLVAKDNNFLVISSTKEGSPPQVVYDMVNWTAKYQLPKDKLLIGLRVAFTGKYSTWRDQILSLYNFTTFTWQKIDSRIIGASIVSFEVARAGDLTAYVSAEGELNVRVYVFSLAPFTGSYDRLTVLAEFEELPPPPETGTLEVTGIPGLQVYTGIVFVGNTPLMMEFPSAFIDITIQAVPIEAGKTTRITIA